MAVDKEAVDRYLEATFTLLIQYLAANQDDGTPPEYDELHQFLLQWIKKHKIDKSDKSDKSDKDN
jgi:hypothetical protein